MDGLSCRVPERKRGFTLIELMVTVAIIAILAAVALPAYTNYVRRGQLSEAFTLLSDYRVKMEQYYQDQKAYGETACVDTNRPAWSTAALPFSGGKYFSIGCTLATKSTQGYTLKATGSGSLTTGYDYTIDNAGNRATTKFADVDGTAAIGSCWATRSASTCDN